MVNYPFDVYDPLKAFGSRKSGVGDQVMDLKLLNIRGASPSIQASRLRSMMLDAHKDSAKIVACPCSYDGLSSRLVEEAGFPIVFLSGFSTASSRG